MSASDERSESDNKWAAGVMGVEPRMVDCVEDANDFRDLLNCEAVASVLPYNKCLELVELTMIAGEEGATEQPLALRRLRSAMEADGEV